jgi:Patatin-like phospholipase
MPANNLSTPRLFRTYSVDKYESPDCAIWEAARATSADPTFFKRIIIGKPPLNEPFVDGGLCCNNPVKQLLSEAEQILPHQQIACVVSIGTGYVATARLPKWNLFNYFIPWGVAEASKTIIMDCEATAAETEKRFRSAPNVYFRFNVQRGMQSVKWEQWGKLSEVTTHTIDYLRQERVDEEVTAAVNAITERREVRRPAHLSVCSLECPPAYENGLRQTM